LTGAVTGRGRCRLTLHLHLHLLLYLYLPSDAEFSPCHLIPALTLTPAPATRIANERSAPLVTGDDAPRGVHERDAG